MQDEQLSMLRVPVLNPTLRHETGDGLVVYVVHTQELLMFNDVGAGIYELIDGQRTVAELLEALLETLPADAERVQGDVERFLEDLVGRGALTFKTPELGVSS
jgi:hypothetical protein